MYDCVIVGAGPAGLSAALNCCRGGLKTAIFEKQYPGGQMPMARTVENYPGFDKIAGFELAQKMAAQTKAAGAEFITGEVTNLEPGDMAHKLYYKDSSCLSKVVILAMGGRPRRLNIPGESRYLGRGVSYCATCDGAFFKGRTVMAVIDGDTGIGDVLYLSGLCDKVYLIRGNPEAGTDTAIANTLSQTPNTELLDGFALQSIVGDKQVEGADVIDVNTGEQRRIPVSAVFIDMGSIPQTFPMGGISLSATGHIEADEGCATNISGIFAAGDVRVKSLYQIVTAAADGALCAARAIKYIGEGHAGSVE